MSVYWRHEARYLRPLSLIGKQNRLGFVHIVNLIIYRNEIGYYQNDVFALGNNETLLDIGACVGNSIWPFVEAVEGAYHTIIALEPDEDNCLLLQDRILERSLQNVIVKQVCAYEKEGFVKFSGEQEQGGIQEDAGQYRLCPVVTVDRLCKAVSYTHLRAHET